MADGEQYGPALPPTLAQPKAPNLPIGPVLPPGFLSPQESSNSPQQSETKEDDGSTGALVTVGSGPTQTEEASTSEDMSVIGPMISEMNHGDEVVQAAEEFERRSRRMKDHLTVKAEAEPGPSKREEWMTELPPEMGKNMGVTARTFSKGTGTDNKDRSEWTETPADKLRKEKEGKSKKRKREESDKTPSKLRDDQLQQQIEEYNKKKRPDSLMEMHQKAKKKKKKKEEKKRKKDKKKGKEEEKEERRPFDRDQDLKVNHFDDAQRKSIIKRSAMLNSRFHHSGSTSSFL